MSEKDGFKKKAIAAAVDAIAAAAVYTYNVGSGVGMATVIVDNGGSLPSSHAPAPSVLTVTPNMETRLNGDPKVEAFTDSASTTASDLRVIATDREAGKNRDVNIYDPVNFLNSPTTVSNNPIDTQTWPEENLYTVVRLGNYLYGIDYDLGIVFEVSGTLPYTATGRTYQQPVSRTSSYPARGQELIVVDGVLYGLFAYPDSSFTNYDPSVVVRFDVSGTNITAVATSDETPVPTPPPPTPPTQRTSFSENAFALATDGSYLYVASIGGRQGQGSANVNSALQRIPAGFLNGDPALPVLDPTQLPNGQYEFRDICFDGNGTAYLFTGIYNNNWNMDWTIYTSANITNPRSLIKFDDALNVAGYFWSAQYTADNDRLWFAHGNDIWVYDAANAASAGILTMSALIGSSTVPYDSLNDLCLVGVDTTGRRRALRGYKSHWQRSNSDLARAVRALTKGRPEPTEEEVAQARASLAK
jgi:hypothetical protein